MFEFDFRNIIVLFSLGIHLSLLWVLIRYGRNTQGGHAYTAAILAIAGWVLPMTVFRSHFLGETLLWAKMLYAMATFTSITFLYFTVVFPRKSKIHKTWYILIFIETIALIVALFHPTAIIQDVVIMSTSEDIIIWGPLYPWFVNHISLPFLVGFILLFKKSKKEVGKRKKQVIAILIGYFLGANLAMVTNLLLPWVGYFELNWLGQFFSTLVAVFTTYAILRLQLLNIRMISTELFIILLNFFLFIRLILSTSTTEIMVNGILFAGIILISILLLRSVKIEVKQKESLGRLAQKLKRSNSKLKELDVIKTEFLSIATHQLRTPLSIIKGFVSLLDEGAYGKVNKEQREIFHNIDVSNERLVKLVDEFLNISRIEQGRTKYHFEKMSANDVVDSVITELSEKARPKGIVLDVHMKKLPDMIGDADRLRHCFFNFIDNAIKYNDVKSTIDITLDSHKNGIRFRVNDKGPGLDEKDIKNLFQKFYRSSHVSRDFEGTGLGIFVVKEFIEAHGGEVWAKSEGIGKGSEFGFWLPLKPKKRRSKK